MAPVPANPAVDFAIGETSLDSVVRSSEALVAEGGAQAAKSISLLPPWVSSTPLRRSPCLPLLPDISRKTDLHRRLVDSIRSMNWEAIGHREILLLNQLSPHLEQSAGFGGGGGAGLNPRNPRARR